MTVAVTTAWLIEGRQNLTFGNVNTSAAWNLVPLRIVRTAHHSRVKYSQLSLEPL
jgi:hypothetical protein